MIKKAVCKRCRRAGEKLMLKGERCLTPKCSFVRRSYPPGEHGLLRKRLTEFGRQLREKNKVREIYGLTDRQLKNYFKEAKKKGISLLQILETRLSNVVYRLGLASSRRKARQLINHGHIKVNGKKVNIPSYRVKEGDVIEVKDPKSPLFSDVSDILKKRETPPWLKFDLKSMRGEVLAFPKPEEIGENIEERLIIEYYSK